MPEAEQVTLLSYGLILKVLHRYRILEHLNHNTSIKLEILGEPLADAAMKSGKIALQLKKRMFLFAGNLAFAERLLNSELNPHPNFEDILDRLVQFSDFGWRKGHAFAFMRIIRSARFRASFIMTLLLNISTVYPRN